MNQCHFQPGDLIILKYDLCNVMNYTSPYVNSSGSWVWLTNWQIVTVVATSQLNHLVFLFVVSNKLMGWVDSSLFQKVK